MKLASLKQKWSDSAKQPLDKATDEYYPTVYFDEALLDALDVETARVGTELQMIAVVRVATVSESKSGSRSMSFEIIEAAMAPKEKEADKAAVLFPNERGSK